MVKGELQPVSIHLQSKEPAQYIAHSTDGESIKEGASISAFEGMNNRQVFRFIVLHQTSSRSVS